MPVAFFHTTEINLHVIYHGKNNLINLIYIKKIKQEKNTLVLFFVVAVFVVFVLFIFGRRSVFVGHRLD
jgi:hypothetical protein